MKIKDVEFRAWDKINKQMRTIITLHNPLHMNFCVYATGQSSDSIHELYYDDCEVMQCSGVKDKNGIKLFDGDMLQYDTSKEMSNWCSGEKALVVFLNGAFMGRMKPFNERTGSNQNMLRDCSDVIEIVGNIYQATKKQKKDWGLE